MTSEASVPDRSAGESSSNPVTTTFSPLGALVVLAGIDREIALCRATISEANKRLESGRANLKSLETTLGAKEKVVGQSKRRFDDESGQISSEREKLVLRRKSLAALNNYKLQQSAEKEITFNSRELDKREEALLATLSALESQTTDLDGVRGKLAGARSEHVSLEERELAAINTASEQLQALTIKRGEQIQSVKKELLSVYDKVHARFPADPLVPVKENRCSGCHMQLVPQVVVQVLKGEQVVKCPGCARILYLPSI